MTPMAAILKELVAAGLQGEQLVAAFERIEAATPKTIDEAAQKRREWDRQRKAEQRAAKKADLSTRLPPDPVDIGGIPPDKLPLARDEVLPLLTKGDKEERKNLVHRASSNGRQIFKTEFKEWYQVYPRHEGKLAAEKAFNKTRTNGVSLEILKAGAATYAAQPIEPQYRKLPATWLNGGCWDDEHTPPINGHAAPQQTFRYEDLPNYYDVVKDAVKPEGGRQ